MYDWRIISANNFIDINSISLTEHDFIYEYWSKLLNAEKQTKSIREYYGNNICLMTKSYVNIKTKQVATVAGVIYNYDCSQAYNNYELPFEALEWDSIPPGSNAAIIYDIIRGIYMPPKLVILHPFISVLYAVMTGFILTYILGCFYLIDRAYPLLPFVVISYTVHPLYRYVFNVNIVHLFGHSFWRRLIVSTITYKVLWFIATIGNNLNVSN